MSEDDYFKSKIHNAEEGKRGKNPTYAILSMEDGFDREDAKTRLEDKNRDPPEHIFILINGQQTLTTGSRERLNEKFGKALCGGERIGGNIGYWWGDYKILTRRAYKSVASEIYDTFGHRDLVFNVLNAKYDWRELKGQNDSSFENFTDELQYVLSPIKGDNHIKYIVIGFSRGGMFALRLGEWLGNNGYGKEQIVITIDPVQNPSKERQLNSAWARRLVRTLKRRRIWKISNDIRLFYSQFFNPFKDMRAMFPILPGRSTRHYNVFQRQNRTWDMHNTPIGSAVQGAIAPPSNLTGPRHEQDWELFGQPIPNGSPYDQYDLKSRGHTYMPRKYRDWVISIVKKECGVSDPILQPLKCTPSTDLPGAEISITGGMISITGGLLTRPIFFNSKKITDQKFEDGKIKITIPDVSPGVHDITYGQNPGPFGRTQFIVEPYLTDYHLKIKDPRSQHPDYEIHMMAPGAEVTVEGKFPSDKNELFLNDEPVPAQFGSKNKFSFKVPKTDTGGLMEFRIKHDKWYSNYLEVFIEPFIEGCYPCRAFPGDEVVIAGRFGEEHIKVYFDDQEVSTKTIPDHLFDMSLERDRQKPPSIQGGG